MNKPASQGQTVAAALGSNEALTGLMQRVRDSKARLQAIQALLPPGLRDDIRSGPLDDSAWVLLVCNAAAAAKLRQLLPALQSELGQRGWPGPPIRIKVLPRC